MDEWIEDELVAGKMNGQLKGRIDRSMDGWMHACMHACMDAWKEERVDSLTALTPENCWMTWRKQATNRGRLRSTEVTSCFTVNE